MPIQVICPGCHTRFTVGDQHAGKTGACPKCKGPIEIPAAGDEVVIHAPELEAGAKDSQGRSVLKPIRRRQAKFSANITAIVIGLVILGMAIAWLVGQSEYQSSTSVLATGAILLGPLLAYAGYTFLRDEELGVFQGTDLFVRSLGCGLVYALLWGLYLYLGTQIFGNETYSEGLNALQIGILSALLLFLGAGTALVCFDFDLGTGFFHYALYLGVTIVLRVIMGLPIIPGMGG